MKNLQELAEQCKAELLGMKIEIGSNITFCTNTRAKTCWGKCKAKKDGSFVIEVNPMLLQDESSDKGIKNTLMHELLHTVKGAMNHGKRWQKLADKVNSLGGYSIKTRNSLADYEITINPDTYWKYKIVCSHNPEHVWYRQRASKAVTRVGEYLCPYCKSTLNVIKTHQGGILNESE